MQFYLRTFVFSLLAFFQSNATGVFGQNITQLRSDFKRTQSDTSKARLAGLIAWELKFTDAKTAIQFAEQEIALGKRQNDYKAIADGFRVKALTLVIQDKIQEGMPFYDSALVYARKSRDFKLQASCYSLMAGMYGDHGDYADAIRLYAAGYQIAQKSGDPTIIATLANNLAESYQSDGRSTNLAQKYFKLALNQSLSAKNWAVAGMNAANLAREYSLNRRWSEAEKEIRRAAELTNRNSEDIYQFATNNHIMAAVYLDLNQLKNAENCALISARLMDSLNRPDNLLRPLSVLTAIYLKQNQLNLAERYAFRLLKSAQSEKAKLFIKDAYAVLSTIAKRKNNWKASLNYFELFKQWNDSVFQEVRERSISAVELRSRIVQKELEVRYQTKAKARENTNLKLQNENLELERWAIVISCLVLFLLGVGLFIANRRTRKINKTLAEQKAVIELQAQEKGILVDEIHHRVKNNLTMLKSLLFLQSRTAVSEETKAMLNESQARIQSMALVHQNLYNEDNAGSLDFMNYLETMFTELSFSFKPKGKQIHFEVTGDCGFLNVSQAIPLGLLLNEMVTNSLKYAFVDAEIGEIVVDIQETETDITLRYHDSGPGLPNGFIPESGSFGFKLIGILIRQLSATIDYYKEANLNQFNIVIPKNEAF